MTLTSSVKEIGAIYTFVIKNWLKPGLIQVNKNDKHLANGVDGDADALWLDVVGVGLGATTAETKLFFHKN